MKKICFVTTVSITLRTFVLKTAQYLHEKGGYDISFICSPDEEFQKSLPDYIHFIPVPMKRGISLGGIKAMRTMTKIFKREKFDLVQYSTPNASLYASMAAKKAKIPVRLYCQWGIVYSSFQGLKRRIFKCIEKYVCKCSTWIEPDSHGNLEFSHAEGLYSENKSSVVWNGSANGVDLKKYDFSHKQQWREIIWQQYNIPSDAFVFGALCRITWVKGINELLAATRQIMENTPNVYLLLVGDEENVHLLNQELLSWAKNHPRVIFHGFTNVPEQYLAAMDCHVLPSYREGFGSVIIDAEAMGVPVIVTDIPGPTNAMLRDKTGLVVPMADVVALQKAMERMLADPDMCRTMGQAGNKFVSENFEETQLFAHILADRQRLLGEREAL